MNPKDLFGDLDVVIVGGVATRAYAPERATKDIDFLVEHSQYVRASQRLQQAGFSPCQNLLFPNASLELYGSSWQRGQQLIDLLASPQDWARRAVRQPATDPLGLAVAQLPYLVLMKFDSARAIDQGDLVLCQALNLG